MLAFALRRGLGYRAQGGGRECRRSVGGPGGFEPTTPGLKVRDPSDEPGTQAPAAGIRVRMPIDEASPDDLPEKAEGRPSAALAMHALQRLMRAGAGDGNRTRDNLPARNKVTPEKDPIVTPSGSKTGVKSGWISGACGRWGATLPGAQPLPHPVRRTEPLVGPRRLLRIVGRRVPPHHPGVLCPSRYCTSSSLALAPNRTTRWRRWRVSRLAPLLAMQPR